MYGAMVVFQRPSSQVESVLCEMLPPPLSFPSFSHSFPLSPSTSMPFPFFHYSFPFFFPAKLLPQMDGLGSAGDAPALCCQTLMHTSIALWVQKTHLAMATVISSYFRLQTD